MRFISVLSAVALTGLAVFAGCDRKPEPKPQAKPEPAPVADQRVQPLRRIAVVPKGTTHEYWKSIHAGARRAERELGGIEITFRGPEKEDDRDQQISLMQNLVSAKYDAIVLAPLDDRALATPVKQAAEAKIPVVIMDSGLQAEAGRDYISFVATDNEKGGGLAGAKMSELLGGKGRVLLLRYQEGSASTALREKGFVDAASNVSGIQVVDPKRYAGATRATAQEAAENLLAAHPDIDGVFCPNESTTFGMMLALRSRGLAGKVKFIGFDASPELVDAMRRKEIHGLVVQDPVRMGYLAVKAAADHLRGLPVEPRIDTGVGIVTPETMDTPENKQLLSPDLKALLGS